MKVLHRLSSKELGEHEERGRFEEAFGSEVVEDIGSEANVHVAGKLWEVCENADGSLFLREAAP